jgi:hypothetical protein
LAALLMVQPFLMAAFAVATAGEAQHRQHFHWFSFLLVPLVGLVVALVALLAVLLEELRLFRLRRRLYNDLQLANLADNVCPNLGPCAQATSLFYAVALPVVFGGAWVYLLGHGGG